MNFVANFTCFPVVQKFENRLRFDKITESLKVGTFLRHSVYALTTTTTTTTTTTRPTTRPTTTIIIVIIIYKY